MKKIMIVEDELLIALSMQNELEDFGFQVCGLVNSGEKALEEMERERPDLVLMDVNLGPSLDGIETARSIKSRYGTPIIFLTGYSDEKLMKSINEIGPAGCFTKPVEITDIIDAINSVL